MNEKLIYVYIDIKGSCKFVGRLWHHYNKGRESSSFEYDRNWLKDPEHFALEPALMLTDGKYHTEKGLNIFGSLGDSAPDRWGRILMKRAQLNKAFQEDCAPKTLSEIDYLLMVNDKLRQGALRFSLSKDGPFLSDSEDSIPPIIELTRLINASENIINSTESNEDLLLLVAPGSSLGGARPKSCVINKDGILSIAKFPRKDDYTCVEAWESVALTIAKQAGITVPEWRYENILNKPVIIENRFDRKGEHRIPFLSAMSMIGARDNEIDHSYLEIVEAIHRNGSKVNEDLKELFKRISLNILISNTDDHLRNHGFLYDNKGWFLSPVYDINPVPTHEKSRYLSLNINLDNNRASIDTILSISDEFRLKNHEAKEVIKSIAVSASQWRLIAKNHHIHSGEIEKMSSAFEHDDLQKSLQF